MRLPPPVKVGKLQTALHTKAKNSPDYRFYALYDKVYRRDVLEWALVRCLRNGGVPGVDGQSFDDIEKLGRDQWLDELAAELRKGTYQPQPVRRVFIPKVDGKQRPLGIPCIKDRVVQTATMLVLEPIFGSPALSMMRGRHPAHRSSFSREFSVVPGRKSADFIESAGEPLIVLCSATLFVGARQLVRQDGGRVAYFTVRNRCNLPRRAHQLASAYDFL